MIKKRIPEKFEYDDKLIIEAIQSIIPNTPFSMNSRGLITIDANLTPTQKQQLKDAITPLLTEIDDITL